MPRDLAFMDPGALLARTLDVRAQREEVHIWPVRLEGSEAARAQCEKLLSSSEIERARRFYFEHLRTSFIFAHGLMRYVLGAYRGVDPTALEFTTGEFGKPALAGLADRRDSSQLAFNLSHSHGRALLAVSAGRDVGVDIEQENPRTDVLGIASSYFFGSERDSIVAAAPERRMATFFRYWAAKESVMKAEGAGLHLPLDSFHVQFDAELASARIESLDPARVRTGWIVRSLACDPGWHAAVAALSDDWQVKVMA
jgi:4'-phosphopantetheinyl transferase